MELSWFDDLEEVWNSFSCVSVTPLSCFVLKILSKVVCWFIHNSNWSLLSYGFRNICVLFTCWSNGFVLFSWRVFDASSYSQLVRDKYECYPENGGGNQSPIATGMVHQVPSFGSDSDWMEPSMHLCHSRTLKPHAYDQVYNAFDLLRTEPSVQVILSFVFLITLSSCLLFGTWRKGFFTF